MKSPLLLLPPAPLLPGPSHEGGEQGGKERAVLAIALAPRMLLIPLDSLLPSTGSTQVCSVALSLGAEVLPALLLTKARGLLRLNPQEPMAYCVRWDRLKAPEL